MTKEWTIEEGQLPSDYEGTVVCKPTDRPFQTQVNMKWNITKEQAEMLLKGKALSTTIADGLTHLSTAVMVCVEDE